MILFSLVNVSNLCSNGFLLNKFQFFCINVWMLFSFGCFSLFLSSLLCSDFN